MDYNVGMDWEVKRTASGWMLMDDGKCVAAFGAGHEAYVSARLAQSAADMRSELARIIHHLDAGNVPSLEDARQILHALDEL